MKAPQILNQAAQTIEQRGMAWIKGRAWPGGAGINGLVRRGLARQGKARIK